MSWKASGDMKFNVPTCVSSSILVLSSCKSKGKVGVSFFRTEENMMQFGVEGKASMAPFRLGA